MSLLDEIQDAAAGTSMDLATLLRRCQILAARLNIKPAEDWLERELDGYPDDAAVPSYRVLPVTLKGDFIGAYHRADDYTIPPALVPKEARKDVERVEYRKSVSSIEHLIQGAGSDGYLSVPMGNLPLLLGRKVFPEMQCVAAHGVIGTAAMVDILNAVRNRVLRFSLELGKQAPGVGEVGQKATKEVEAKATQIFNTTIYGSANFVASAQNSHVGFNVNHRDFASLKKVLVENGVSEVDVADLKSALDAEPTATMNAFGAEVSGWIAKMTMKAAEGSWSIGLSAAGNLLARAIAKYYGL